MDKILQKRFYKKAHFANFVLQFVPFVRLISINGSLVFDKAREDSDIDFFIIAQKNRLWIVRFSVNLLLDLFFLRAKLGKKAGRICINHLITDRNYKLTPQNKYNARQYSNLIVLFAKETNISKDFIINNQWMKKYFPEQNLRYRIKKSNLANFFSLFGEFILLGKFGDLLEKRIKKFQINRIENKEFFRQRDSLLKITDDEFYYYTEVGKQLSKARQPLTL